MHFYRGEIFFGDCWGWRVSRKFRVGAVLDELLNLAKLFLTPISCSARVPTIPAVCPSCKDAFGISSSSKRGHSQI